MAADQTEGRVVLVVAGGISIRDIADPAFPHLWDLMHSGSAALMNVRTGRASKDIDPVDKPGMEPGCVSLGAGTLAVAGAETRRAAGVDCLINGVRAGSIYKSRTALDYGDARIVHTEIGKILRANEEASYRAHPGVIGSALHEAGIKTAVIGNSDIPGQMHHEAVAIAMDKNGIVDLGNIDLPSLALVDSDSPYGIRTDQAALMSEFDQAANRCRFIVIDVGDTSRADIYADSCTNEQAAMLRRQSVHHLDDFISKLTAKLDFNKDVLIVLSPNSRSFSDIDEEKLAPVIVKGPGFGVGTLTSPSTRRPGLITISDVAPTIISLLRVEPEQPMGGRPFKFVKQNNNISKLLQLNLDAAKQDQRQPAMRVGSIVQSVAVILVTLAVVLGVSRPVKKLAAWVALVPLAIPIAMLYLPLVYSGGLVGTIIWLIVITAAIVLVCSMLFRNPVRAMGWLCGIVVVSLMVDLVRGAPLIKSSVAGYGMIEGARYYGIGNELMGTMLGSSIIGMGIVLAAWNAQAWKKWMAAIIVYVLVLVFIGAPNLGVNLGGALAAALALCATLLARRGKWPGWRTFVVALLVVFIAFGALFGPDLLRGGASQSHVGRALSASGSGSDILWIAERKMALNFMLLATSVWSRLLALSLIGYLLALWQVSRKALEIFPRDEKAAMVGTFIGICGAFAFNDSGVLAAATCAVVLWMLPAVRLLSLEQTKGPRDISRPEATNQ
ncbi:hypothetical protein LLG46_08985 [bacterium]|nr:hypothetical protein [bacterium]